jgi:hypothetical protein
LPQWSLALGLASIVAAVLVEVWFHPRWDFRLIWLGTALGLGAVGWWTHRTSTAAPTAGARTSQPQWAYGPLGRLLVGGLIAWQIAAVATWLLPDKDCLSSFHAKSRNAFAFWLTRTTTDQGWGMFAPNPPRSNVFLKVLVTDAQGEVWDLKTDVYAAEQKPIPWIWNTRLRKMNRRIIGGESGPNSWYRKWYARYECRQWAREHDGEAPEKVELVKLWYSIPTPEQTRDKGYYVAEDRLERNGFERVAHSEICRQTVMGQLPNFIRERDGLPVLEPGEYRPWIKHKRSKWQKRRAAENR